MKTLFRHAALAKVLLALALVAPLARMPAEGPVGPFTFFNNAEYDSNFKESIFDRGNTRDSAGYLKLVGFQYGPAVFDTSATGGFNGSGGTDGNDANSDFSNFTISADFASSEEGVFGMGFLLRLDSNEANGYFAAVLANSADSVEFDLFAGAGLNEGFGSNIFSTVVPLNGLTLTTNRFFPFKVTAKDGNFGFDFGVGAATASFTDTTPSATVGQVGFVLTTASPSAATRMDNFAVVPEPAATVLALWSGVLCLGVRRCGFRGQRFEPVD